MTVTGERPTFPGFDPLDPAFRLDPFPTWSRAQAETPVFFYEEMGFWVITRFDDVLAAVTDHRTFSSRAVGVIPPPADLAAKLPGHFFDHSFVAIDPPEHTGPRKAANSGFTRPRVAAMEATIAATAHALIDAFVDDGSCDLMQQFCYPLSLRTIVQLLGLPAGETDLANYRQWTEDMFALMSPVAKDAGEPVSRTLPEDELRARWGALVDAAAFYKGLIDDRRANPGKDMLTVLAGARTDDGTPLSDDRIITHIQEMIAAGNDTTANLIGSLLLYLSEQPEDFAELKGHPELLGNAVEEGLRRRGSSVGMFRATTRDVTVAGEEIPQGSLVFLAYQATGHDPSHFPDPRRVDIHRANASEHLSFGRGRHFCMGAPLARLEAQVALRVLFERLPTLEVVPDQELEFAPTLTVSMLHSLAVRW